MQRITDKILIRYDRKDLRVYRGAAKPSDLYQKNQAVDALASVLRKKRLSILAMGRMTTVAGLILHYPELVKQIDQVIVNFGRRLETETFVGPRNIIMPDTNVDGDLESTKILIDSGIKVILIPTELMADQFINRSHMNMLKNGSENAKWLRKNFKLWKLIWKIYPGTEGFIPWDLFLVGFLTAPNDFRCDQDIPIAMKRLKNNTSRVVDSVKTEFKSFVVASYKMQSHSLGTYCYEVDDGHLTNWVEHLRRL
jgi:pyrimidine-specific ribonucleoside hydrolase